MLACSGLQGLLDCLHLDDKKGVCKNGANGLWQYNDEAAGAWHSQTLILTQANVANMLHGVNRASLQLSSALASGIQGDHGWEGVRPGYNQYDIADRYSARVLLA